MRADKFLAERFGTRSKAKEKLLRGVVFADGKRLFPDTDLKGDEEITVTEENSFVSRGGDKLKRGLQVFSQSVEGGVYADLGASTGGFTDCLLQGGVGKVYCVDVGENQLDERLKADARVVVMDNTNARFLKKSDFPQPLDGIFSDLSFISLKLMLPVLFALADESCKLFLLFKPQFECGKGRIGKSGILPVTRHAPLLDAFYDDCLQAGFYPHGVVNAPVHVGKNVEYVVYLSKRGPALSKWEFLRQAENLYETRTNN